MRYLPFLFLLLAVAALNAQVHTGKASFYADAFEGKPTASGEKYRADKFTAAHRTLPFGTVLRVTNVANNLSVDVTVNDRGPFVEGRVVDLSKAAAKKLKFVNLGTAEVRIEILSGNDGKGKAETVVDQPASEKEYYNFDTEKVQPTGLGVQLATYQELANLFHVADGLKNTYKKKTVVQVKVVNGVKYYSLILGPFSSKGKAQNFVSEVKKQFPGAFVLDYAKP